MKPRCNEWWRLARSHLTTDRHGVTALRGCGKSLHQTGKRRLRGKALSGTYSCGTAKPVPFVERVFPQAVKSCPDTKHEFFRNLLSPSATAKVAASHPACRGTEATWIFCRAAPIDGHVCGFQ